VVAVDTADWELHSDRVASTVSVHATHNSNNSSHRTEWDLTVQ
jgi:hypothetical protein